MDSIQATQLEMCLWDLDLIKIKLTQLQRECQTRPMTDEEARLVAVIAGYAARFADTDKLPQPALEYDPAFWALN